MLKKSIKGTEFLLLQVFTDLLAVIAGLYLAYWLRFGVQVLPPAGGWDPDQYIRLLPWGVLLWWLSLNWTGNYVNTPVVISFNRARRLLKGSALAVALIVVRNYFLREENIARVLYPMAFLTVTACLVTGRLLLQRILVALFRRRELPRSRVLIVGTGPTAIRLAARFRHHPEYAYELVGFVTASPRNQGRSLGGVPVVGTLAELRRLIRERRIQDVFVAQSEIPHSGVLDLFLESEMEGARVHMIPTLAEMVRSEIFYDEVAGVPVYTLQGTRLSGWNLLLKRVVDVSLAGLGLLSTLPLLPLAAWMIKRQSPGPVFYKQRRLSLDGTRFNIYKLRTMPVDAERDGPGWGNQEDRRATPFGLFLRRWNLDELPQLWNVFRGDMSLVGPRPERPHNVERFKAAFPRYMARHRVRTGMTGWAQVHGLRGDTSISQRLRYDLYYIENWSLWLDLKILLMTFFNLRRRIRHWGRTVQTDPRKEFATTCPPPTPEPDGLSSIPTPARSLDASPGSPAPAEASAAPSPLASPAPGPPSP